MKILSKLTCIFALILSVNVSAQTTNRAAEWQKQILSDRNLSKKEFRKNIVKYDFSALWTSEDTPVYGFIGSNYRRLRIKIISAEKDKNNSALYAVSGKSMVNGNICAFTGTIKIKTARTYKKMHWGVDDEYKNKGIKKQGIVVGEYRFAEKGCIFSGGFEGRFATYWYIDRDSKLIYDDIQKDSDSYRNNQFAGIWKSYRGGIVKNCNWGDYRIPLAGDLDIGAGEFSPDGKYLKFGWQTYHDAYLKNDEQARREEERHWWK